MGGITNFLQRNVVCIGSKVAPVLSNIFLSFVDRDVKKLKDVASLVCTSVDDYLVMIRSEGFTQNAGCVLKVLQECGYGLKFTMESPQENKLQFLDLQLKFERNHLLAVYAQDSEAVTKLWFRAFQTNPKWGGLHVFARHTNSLVSSHSGRKLFLEEINRLKVADYPNSALRMTATKLWNGYKVSKQER